MLKRNVSCVYMQSGNVSAVADLGGSILTGIDGNPLAVLAKQLHIPLHVIDEADVPLYQVDGHEANAALDQEASSVLQLSKKSLGAVQEHKLHTKGKCLPYGACEHAER